METAPVRQPRISPASPPTGRGWRTMAGLVGAVLVGGAIALPPFAAGSLFPSRDAVPAPRRDRSALALPAASTAAAQTVGDISSAPALAIAPTAQASDSDGNANTSAADRKTGDIERVYSDLPIAAEPPNEPPRNPASDAAPNAQPAKGVLATGTLASGLSGSRSASEPEPATELTLQPIRPFDVVTTAPPAARSAIPPPPRPREPLPLQTDLLAAEPPDPPSIVRPNPAPAGGAAPAGKAGAVDRRLDRPVDRPADRPMGRHG